MSHGEWDPRALTPEMKELIDEILYGVAIGSNHHAIRAIQKVFDDVKDPKLYKKVRRYYESEGLQLNGEDPDADYNEVLSCIEEDLTGAL